MIGIFWIYKETLIGRAIDVDDGDEAVPGLVDSPDTHTGFWDCDKNYQRHFPELRTCEYFDVPRGRVIYNRVDCQAIVYMDKTLFNDQTKKLIRDFFDLNGLKTAWRTDPHYTTSSQEIDQLFQ